MQSTLSEERFKQFIDVSKKYFSWEQILEEAKIGRVSDKGDQYEITCPFHDDKRPSMRLTKRVGTYHCFSCGRKGTYTRFLWELNGQNGSYASFCEQVLKAHPAMQAELHFTSLFITQNTIAPEFNQRRKFKHESHLGSDMPITTLASKVRQMDDSWRNLVLSLTLLQQGTSTDSVYALMKKQSIHVEEPEEQFSLSDLI